MMQMDRRIFTRISAMALAATRVPSFAQPPASAAKPGSPTSEPARGGGKPVGYAAIGLGAISDLFMQACAKSQTAKIGALVTGHPETKGKHYAELYGIPESSIYTYDTFDRIADNKDIEAVYVGLPNNMHREYTIRAAHAGKHVLCEKPMAISSGECEAMISACRNGNRLLMIGYRVHYDPTHLEAKRIIQSGALGPLQAFEGAFGFNAAPNQWRLTRQYGGGGPLMDVGIYPLNEIRWLLEEEPSEFTAVSTTRDHSSGRFADVEQTLNWTMKFPSGIVAALGCTYGADMPGFLRIHGDKGSLEITNAYSYQGPHLVSLGGGAHIDTATQGEATFHFQLEAEYFTNCIRTGTVPKTPGEEGLHDLRAIEAIYKAAGTPIA